MRSIEYLQCTLCEKTYPYDEDLCTCPSCGETGILDVIYNYNKMKTVVHKGYFENNHDYSIMRYQPLMTIQPITNESVLHVGWTPLYQSQKLSKTYGVKELYFKDDGQNPTQSLKDRASIVACLKAIEQGKRVVSCSSTGNAASSLAGHAARLGLQSVIFVPERSPIGKQAQIMAYGATLVRVKGDYKDTFQLSKQIIEEKDYYNRNAAINPHLVEGKKTVAYEIIEQLQFEDIDNVFVSVGDGCTIGGVYKGFYDFYQLGLIPRIPRIFGVQSSGCSPFVDAFVGHHELRETSENTIADSIAVGVPRNPVKGMNAVTKSNGRYMSVSDKDILFAQKELAAQEGLFTEPAAATSFAGFKKAFEKEWIKTTDKTVVLLTGNGLKDTKTFLEHTKQPQAIDPNILLREVQTSEDSLDIIMSRLHTGKGENNE